MDTKTRLVVALLSIALISSVVYAVTVANYVIPSSVTVTTMPGITCYNADGSGITGAIEWGDLQTSTSKTFSLYIVNTGGGSVWLLPAQSLTTQNLPSGLVLTWSLSQATLLMPGQQTGNIVLTLTATTSAIVGSHNFNIMINVYDSSSG